MNAVPSEPDPAPGALQGPPERMATGESFAGHVDGACCLALGGSFWLQRWYGRINATSLRAMADATIVHARTELAGCGVAGFSLLDPSIEVRTDEGIRREASRLDQTLAPVHLCHALVVLGPSWMFHLARAFTAAARLTTEVRPPHQAFHATAPAIDFLVEQLVRRPGVAVDETAARRQLVDLLRLTDELRREHEPRLS